MAQDTKCEVHIKVFGAWKGKLVDLFSISGILSFTGFTFSKFIISLNGLSTNKLIKKQIENYWKYSEARI